jgi:uncharacterized protein (DUF983 family)
MKSRLDIGPKGRMARVADYEALRALKKEAFKKAPLGKGIEAVVAVQKMFEQEVWVVAMECKKCGAPMGNKDPDDLDVDEVIEGICADCRD